MISQSAKDRLLALAIWAWLEILEKEKDKLSVSGQVALELLRVDLENLAIHVD